MFDGHFKVGIERGLVPVGQGLKRMGITADHLTAAGLVIACGAAVAIGSGALNMGLLLLVFSALPDLLDGAVAKASGSASPRGAFFDSTADRVTDALLLGGVAWHLAARSRPCCGWPTTNFESHRASAGNDRVAAIRRRSVRWCDRVVPTRPGVLALHRARAHADPFGSVPGRAARRAPRVLDWRRVARRSGGA